MDDYSRHEALHMASFLASAVHEQLVRHPAICANDEYFKLASAAADALSELYHKIGMDHL